MSFSIVGDTPPTVLRWPSNCKFVRLSMDAVMRRAGVDGSVVKGVSAAQLRSGGGDRIRENATTGLAFDDEYRDKLTKDGGHAPSLAHKSKNQIGSLLYNAKQAELKIMEGRLQGVSHKAQARQKYGW